VFGPDGRRAAGRSATEIRPDPVDFLPELDMQVFACIT
jgi:hypothetical protein